MDAMLSLACDDLSEDSLRELAFEMMKTLNDETELEAEIAKEPARAGGRGDVITGAQILLTALSSGTLVALFGVLRMYFARQKRLKIALQCKDGQKLMIQAENLNKGQTDQLIEMAKKCVGESE